MAALSLLLILAHLSFCCTEVIKDEGRPHMHIFHHSCALKKDEGPCKAVKDRFYFDIDTGRCEPFDYGGCQGNANNFETLEACEEMCTVKANKSPCHLEDEPGPCRGLVPRYFFDGKKQECRRFFYGGCFGNANNFKTLKECQDRCQRNDTEEPGHEPNPVEVIKLSEEPRLNSETIREVMSQPQRQPQPDSETGEKGFTLPGFCFSPVNRGEYCDGQTSELKRRYVYKPELKRCQILRYRGCGGNKNNFILKRLCMKMCMPDHVKPRQIRIKTRNSNILFRSI